VGDIDFIVISAAGNSNKFQKTRFWKEKSVEEVVTLGPTAQATLISNEPTTLLGLQCFILLPIRLFKGLSQVSILYFCPNVLCIAIAKIPMRVEGCNQIMTKTREIRICLS
jgi:hypothetical protein